MVIGRVGIVTGGAVVVVVGGVVVVVGGVVVVVGGVVVVVGGVVVVVGGTVVVVGGLVVVVGGLVVVGDDGGFGEGFFEGDEVVAVVGFDLTVELVVDLVAEVETGVNPLVNGNASLFDPGGATHVVVVGAEAAGLWSGCRAAGRRPRLVVGVVTAESDPSRR